MNTRLKNRLAITAKVKHAIRTGYAWPGGYPLSVILHSGEAICTHCAKDNWRNICEETIKPGWRNWRVADVTILWEGGNCCGDCGKYLDAYPSDELETV